MVGVLRRKRISPLAHPSVYAETKKNEVAYSGYVWLSTGFFVSCLCACVGNACLVSVPMCTCQPVCRLICLSACIFVSLPVYCCPIVCLAPCIYLPVCLNVCLFICVFMSVYVPAYLRLPVCLCLCFCMCVCLCLFVCVVCGFSLSLDVMKMYGYSSVREGGSPLPFRLPSFLPPFPWRSVAVHSVQSLPVNLCPAAGHRGQSCVGPTDH